MKRFWNQTLEFKALCISSIAGLVGFLGTMFLFWFHRYDIPLAVLLSGVIVSISWLVLYLNYKEGKEQIKLDIFAIYLRLGLIVIFTAVFAVLEIAFKLVIISPIYLVISYLVISLLTLLAFHRKGA